MLVEGRLGERFFVDAPNALRIDLQGAQFFLHAKVLLFVPEVEVQLAIELTFIIINIINNFSWLLVFINNEFVQLISDGLSSVH